MLYIVLYIYDFSYSVIILFFFLMATSSVHAAANCTDEFGSGKNGELRSPAPAPRTQVVTVVRNQDQKPCRIQHIKGVHTAL